MLQLKTNKVMGRRIPVFRVVLKNGATYEQIQGHPQIREAVLDELIIAIEEGIRKRKSKITLFQIGGSDFNVELSRAQWKQSLNHAMATYAQTEDYEKCVVIQKLISKL